MTAVEFLEEQYNNYVELFRSDFNKALELEKQQIIEAYRIGHFVGLQNRPYKPEQYYETIKNETK
jgi:hypothetical protein